MSRFATVTRRQILMIVGPLALLGLAAVWWLMGGRYEITENAYFHQARIAIAASVTGRVTAVMIHDNQAVEQGDPLFALDDAPYQLALAQAELAVTSARIAVAQLKQGYLTAKAQVRIAEDEAMFQTSERTRQESLAAKGVASGTNLDSARHAEQRARSLCARRRGDKGVSSKAGIGRDSSVATKSSHADKVWREAI